MWAKIFGWGGSAGLGVAMMALPETGWLAQDTAKLVFWAGAIIATCSILGLAWVTVVSSRSTWLSMWIPAWHLKFDGIWPFDRLITIHDAAHYAYPRIKHRSDVQILEKLNKTPNSRLGMVAHFLLTNARFEILLFGSKPPFLSMEIIPKDDADRFKISDDAYELIDQYDDKNKYTNIAMRRRDLMRCLKDLMD